MKRRIDHRLRQARPSALDAVPGGNRNERDLDAAFSQPVSRSARRSSRFHSLSGSASRFPALRPALVVTAAATAVAVVAAVAGAALSGQETETAKPAPAVTNTPLAAVARSALLEAAEIAGQEADLTSQRHSFWHRRGLAVSTDPGRTGTIQVRREDEQWYSVHDEDAGLTIERWANGDRVVKPVARGARPFDLGGKISAAELLKLPTEPQALKAALLARRSAGSGLANAIDPWFRSNPDMWLFVSSAALVTQLPVRTGTRAAGFRLLADLPGVRVTPNAKDPTGRRGTAVSVNLEHAPYGILEHRLMFDPRTSAALSSEMRVIKPGPRTQQFRAGSVLKGTVTQTVEWTTRKPPTQRAASPRPR